MDEELILICKITGLVTASVVRAGTKSNTTNVLNDAKKYSEWLMKGFDKNGTPSD